MKRQTGNPPARAGSPGQRFWAWKTNVVPDGELVWRVYHGKDYGLAERAVLPVLAGLLANYEPWGLSDKRDAAKALIAKLSGRLPAIQGVISNQVKNEAAQQIDSPGLPRRYALGEAGEPVFAKKMIMPDLGTGTSTLDVFLHEIVALL